MSISQKFPGEPSLYLNFAGSKKLDPRITFTRSETVPTATFVDKNKLVVTAQADQPRFDHDPTTGVCNGLLIEDTRTNLLKYSNSFSTGGAGNWTSVGATCVFTQNITGPDGIANGSWTIDDQSTGADAAGVEQALTITPSSSTNYCLSIFAKQGTATYFDFYSFFTGNSVKGSYFRYNFSTDTINVSSSDGGGITPTIFGKIQYPNGWYRLYFVVNDANNGLNNTLQYRIYPGSRDTGVTGTTLFYGAQCEIGPFPTSYIPTTASSVQRIGDLAYIDLPSDGWYNYSQGSLVFQHTAVGFSTLSTAGNPVVGFAQTDGSFANSAQYTFDKTTGNAQYRVRIGNVDQAAIDSNDSSSASKVGFSYATNSFSLARNGSLVGTDSSGSIPQSIGTLLFGANVKDPNSNLNACISSLTYYPVDLSDSQLVALTR
jgi:hypothetical protein